MSESKLDDAKRKWWREKLKSLIYVKRFSGALVGGKIHSEYINSLGIPKDLIFTGYDVVDNEYFIKNSDFARENEPLVRAGDPRIPKKPYFLVVTRLMPRKNIELLFDAYFEYRNIVADTPWDLAICGDGELTNTLINLSLNNNLDKSIHFPGFLTYQEIVYWYGLAGAFVHPALHEQWGLVVNEACASGLPILCSNTVGSSFDLMKEDVNGYLFNPNSVIDMTRCLVKMHQLKHNERVCMGDESRKIISKHSPEIFAKSAISLCQKMSNAD